MNKNIISPYAFNKDNKELVHISEVANGAKCNCYCITCGEDLIAKNGGVIKRPHFSHSINSECQSTETLLHFLAKEVFSEINSIYIPPYESSWIFKFKPQLINFDYIETDGYCSALGERYPIKNVRIEKRLDKIIPDIVATVTIDHLEYDFLIEIAVTHFIDKNKKELIIGNKLNCIEINLSHLLDSPDLWDKTFIKDILNEKKNFKLINQNFVDYNNLILNYEKEILLDGFIEMNDSEFILLEEHFKDKSVWKDIENNFSELVKKKRSKYFQKTDKIDHKNLKEDFEISNILEYGYEFIDLAVTYKDKDTVKRMGAKWNPQTKRWYTYPSNPLIKNLLPWIPNQYKFQIKLYVVDEDVNIIKDLGAQWDIVNKTWYFYIFKEERASFLPYPVIDNNAVYFEKWIKKDKMKEINDVSSLYVKDPNKRS